MLNAVPSLFGAALESTSGGTLAPGWIITILIIAGVALLLLESILPGLISGILGIGCLVAAVAVAYSAFGFRTGTSVALGVAVGLLAGVACWVRFFPQSRMARMFTSHQAVRDLGVERPELLDQLGTAESVLRPSGIATINGRRVDVVAETGLIERGQSVRVIAVEGSKVVVRALG